MIQSVENIEQGKPHYFKHIDTRTYHTSLPITIHYCPDQTQLKDLIRDEVLEHNRNGVLKHQLIGEEKGHFPFEVLTLDERIKVYSSIPEDSRGEYQRFVRGMIEGILVNRLLTSPGFDEFFSEFRPTNYEDLLSLWSEESDEDYPALRAIFGGILSLKIYSESSGENFEGLVQSAYAGVLNCFTTESYFFDLNKITYVATASFGVSLSRDRFNQ